MDIIYESFDEQASQNSNYQEQQQNLEKQQIQEIISLSQKQIEIENQYNNIMKEEHKRLYQQNNQQMQKVMDTLNLTVILVIHFIITGYNQLMPVFFTDKAREHNQSNQTTYLFVFITSIIVCKFMSVWGRKLIMNTGFILLGLSALWFAQLPSINDSLVFSMVSFLSSMTQGIGYAFVSCTNYSLLLILFTEQVMVKVSMIEFIAAAGTVFSQLACSMLYTLGGYSCPYYFYACLLILVLPVISTILPSSLVEQKSVSQQQIKPSSMKSMNSNSSIVTSDSQPLSYVVISPPLSMLKCFSHLQLLFAILIVFSGFTGLSIVISNLAKHLNHLGISNQLKGYFFAISFVSFSSSIPLINLIPSHIPKHIMTRIGILLSAISLLLVGPEQYLNIPYLSQIYVVSLALFILGVGGSMVMIPIVPQMMEFVQEVYHESSDKAKKIDMSNGCMQMAISMAGIIGPNIGGYLCTHYGFRRACSLFACNQLILLCAYQLSLNAKQLCSCFTGVYVPLSPLFKCKTNNITEKTPSA